MPPALPTRRTILGAAGASALSSILLPWRPKPQDILIASEIHREVSLPQVEVVPLFRTGDVIMARFDVARGTTTRWEALIGQELRSVYSIAFDFAGPDVVRCSVVGEAKTTVFIGSRERH